MTKSYSVNPFACAPQKHISKEANFWKKNEGLIPGVGVKGVGMRTILERQGWRGKKENVEKINWV